MAMLKPNRANELIKGLLPAQRTLRIKEQTWAMERVYLAE
jgi:hypothetical protein